ncbi:hypothetical protein [Clostridium intestinale]|nr:hypothetical protein [Clostridium intestinale]
MSVNVTGADTTSTIPTPTTSPVLVGEFPSRLSPCDETAVNTTKLGLVDV